jgi:predicted esterase
MDTKRWFAQMRLITAILLAVILNLAGCVQAPTPAPTPTSVPLTTLSAATPTALPTLSLDQTYAKQFVIDNFDAVHLQINGDSNKYLILGNLPVSKPAVDLPNDLAVFLGRWEGYVYAPPVTKDYKVVLVIQEISAVGGKAIGWSGTNLQYPDRIGEVQFRVVRQPGQVPAIEFQSPWAGGSQALNTFSYDPEKGLLQGWIISQPGDSKYGPFVLNHERAFYVYKDYAGYLAGKGITAQTYKNSDMQRFGKGYLLYLPTDYADHPDKTYPLIFFLHGYGDRGDNIFLLAKASPFMFIREKGPLPLIIAAPLLNAADGYSTFPDVYMDRALAEIQANYRVDAQRIYVTGLSMGGEGTYRFAVNHPKTFAAIAPLSAYVDSWTYAKIQTIKDVPVWAIHGADDIVVPLAKAQQPVDALKEVGGNVKFTILAGHDHDTWDVTYSDPAFYDWLLQHQK